MKIQLYGVASFGENNDWILRQLDGKYTLVKMLSPFDTTRSHPGDYYYTVPGKECSQYWAEHVKKATLLRAGHPGWNQFAWGIPEDAELYDEIKLYGQPVSENA